MDCACGRKAEGAGVESVTEVSGAAFGYLKGEAGYTAWYVFDGENAPPRLRWRILPEPMMCPVRYYSKTCALMSF